MNYGTEHLKALQNKNGSRIQQNIDSLKKRFDVCRMSNTGKFPKVKLLFEANKAPQKLKSRTDSLIFPQLERPSLMNIVRYADATYATLEDGSSQSGFIIFVCGTINRIAPICWSSKKLDQVTKSPLAAETLALSEAAEAGVL